MVPPVSFALRGGAFPSARGLWSRVLPALLACLLLAGTGAAWALDRGLSAAQFRHTSWTLGDGAPGNIRAIAQGRDGYLWLGSATGLYRFDGIRFERVMSDREEPGRSLQVTALLAARNGDIWVGYDFGGIALYRGGRLRSANPWPPKGGVDAIVEDRQGGIWVSAESKGRMVLSRRIHGRWSRAAVPEGGEMGPVLAAANGSLFMVLPPLVLRLDPGANRFMRMPVKAGTSAALAQDSRGQVWLGDDTGLRRLDGPGPVSPLDSANMPYVRRRMAFDRDDNLWITAQDKGLARIRPGMGAENLNRRQGLTADLALAMAEDREGNVWIGTESGLDRFSPTAVVQPEGSDGLVTGFVRDARTGRLFVAGLRGVYRVDGAGGAPELIFRKPEIGVMCGDAHTLLAISLGGAWRLDLREDGRLAAARKVTGPLSVSCALDRDGTFWTGMDRLYRLAGNRLEPATGAAGMPGGTMMMLRPDAAGGLIAQRSGTGSGFVRLAQGRIAPLWPSRDIAVGSVNTVLRLGEAYLLGGQKGLARARQGRIVSLSERDHPFLAGITGILRTPPGEGSRGGATWLIGATGIVRLDSAALDRAFDHPAGPLPFERFGYEQGFRARSNVFDANDIARDAAGKLWFVTNRGLAWIDPAHPVRNRVVPPVRVLSLTADGTVHAADGGEIRLPPGANRIQVDYTVLSLTDARANRFRYRLKGADEGWVEAGHDRQALYTNLDPGNYVFQLAASNNDGLWNPDGAELRFSIAPAFYQTRWFAALCLAVLAAGLWLLYRSRLHYLAQRTRHRFEAQLAERERIARELHDTLLQGFQGLMLRFQSVVEMIPPGQQPRRLLEAALERADDVLLESREHVHRMRTQSRPVPLRAMLEDAAAEVLPPALACRIAEEGARRLVNAPAAQEIARIAREALTNAARHAGARHVEIVLRHRRDRLDLRIRDDGRGLPDAVARSGLREGHYGLIGMRERAAALAGTLTVRNHPDGGVEVRLSVPARIAFRRRSNGVEAPHGNP